MLKTPVYIVSMGSLSPSGSFPEEVWESYTRQTHYILQKEIEGNLYLGAWLPAKQEETAEALRRSRSEYQSLDWSVIYGIYAARMAFKFSGWETSSGFGINMGSSRGATGLFEQYYDTFKNTGRTLAVASPLTTLGNISSWVAQDLQNNGPEISHSITCSTALHAVLNGVAWILSGLTDKFLVGAAEAPLTPFTIAQMQALRVYARKNRDFPCRALDFAKTENTMVMGEGGAAACLQLGKSENALVSIIGIGYATETMAHATSLSEEAVCLQKSMKMALGELPPSMVDVVVTHAPGTIKGDNAEIKAIQKVFGTHSPALANNKWKIGHSLGASGMFNLEMAIQMLKKKIFIPIPYLNSIQPSKIQMVMVNAVGFGGNAASILISSVK